MNNILHTLFIENPCLPEEVTAFCKTLPEYQEADQEYQAAQEKLIDRLGYEAYSDFERIQTNYMARLVHAYYLFGLHLRQEVLSALAG